MGLIGLMGLMGPMGLMLLMSLMGLMRLMRLMGTAYFVISVMASPTQALGCCMWSSWQTVGAMSVM